ncbi:LON peptidase N-terminal domain and RING finger protein 3-like [Drosophila ficusphila]|uniref:LON peptidase N-terminal domain and RING finger protein 3-like n=1 Tax=Drosophila ficusphila TaxID=30025 RepID=UPI0007E70ACA|nr:LON peptidase N-terminal domain and RING finger protein 3-like [Drosophila ficusphila]
MSQNGNNPSAIVQNTAQAEGNEDGAVPGCSNCIICGESFASHEPDLSSFPSEHGEENEQIVLPNDTSGQNQSGPSVEVCVSVATASGPPITVGISGGQLAFSQAPISFSLSSRHSTNVVFQIKPSGSSAAAPAQPASSNEVPMPSNCVSVLRCPICLGSANNPRATACGHIFCNFCLQRALSIRPVCPVCGVAQEYRNALQIFP